MKTNKKVTSPEVAKKASQILKDGRVACAIVSNGNTNKHR